MDIASLVNSPKARRAPSSRGLQLLRVQAAVLLHGSVCAVKDSVLAFRQMHSVLTQGALLSK